MLAEEEVDLAQHFEAEERRSTSFCLSVMSNASERQERVVGDFGRDEEAEEPDEQQEELDPVPPADFRRVGSSSNAAGC